MEKFRESSTLEWIRNSKIVRVLAILATMSASGCKEDAISTVQYKTKKCLTRKISGLHKKACEPKEAEKLLDFAKKKCPAKSFLLTQSEIVEAKRAAINDICKEAAQKPESEINLFQLHP